VSAFKVNGNTLLAQPAVDAVLEPFKGERTAAELAQAANALQELYGRRGYGAVVAYLPPQDLSRGEVTITVVEGRLGRVNVSGNKQFDEANIRASLPALALGATPRLRRIDSQIQMANENPAKQVQVLLQPGQQSGEAQANVTVVERPVRHAFIGLDSTGNSRTGDLRLNVGWQHANLWNRDHVFSAQLQTSVEHPELVKVVSAAYRAPLYAQLIAIDTYFAYSDVDGGSTATLAGNLQFNGKGRLFGARATRYLPRWGEFDQRVSLAIDERDYINNCSITGLPAGACGPAGESVSVQPLSVEYSARRGGSVPLGLNVALAHNLQIGGGHAGDDRFEAARPGSRPRYTALRFGGFAGTTIAETVQLQGRLAGQFTNDALVSGEQFGIGGIESVRGYEERELAGDRGAVVSFEVIGPDVSKVAGASSGDLRLLAFIDGGRIENRLGTPCLGDSDRCTLSSYGVGARFNTRNLAARLYVAEALKTAARTERHSYRAHFSVSYVF
jgi:hemolysin activation/secretion protein